MPQVEQQYTNTRSEPVLQSILSARDIVPTQPLTDGEREIFAGIIKSKPPDQWARMPLDIELVTTLARLINRHRQEMDKLLSEDLVVMGSYGPKVSPRLGVVRVLFASILKLQYRLGLAPTEAQEQKIRSKTASERVSRIKTLTEGDRDLLPMMGPVLAPVMIDHIEERPVP
jgi:hypothetical protein